MKSDMTPEEKAQIKVATERRKKAMPKRKPVWKRTDIDESKNYVLLLLKNDAGFREFELREINKQHDPVKGGQCSYTTEIIPIELVFSGNVMTISENVKLNNGENFTFTSNGQWLTSSESKKIMES